MKLVTSCRKSVSPLLGLVLFALLGGSESKVQASCGDYLQHSDSMAVPGGANLPDQDPSKPMGSSCANGQCHAHIPTAPSEQSRVVVLRHFAFVLFYAEFKDRDEKSWPRLGDVLLPGLPCDEVPSPPPELA